MSKKDAYLKIFSEHKEDIVSDFMYIADNFYHSAIVLLEAKGDNWSSYMMPSGFLAARSAECYLKALNLCYELSPERYSFCYGCAHDLVKLYSKLINDDPEIVRLKGFIESLNKYSADKVSYPEFQYYEGAPDVFGSDEVWPIKAIRGYVVKKIDWE